MLWGVLVYDDRRTNLRQSLHRSSLTHLSRQACVHSVGDVRGAGEGGGVLWWIEWMG